MSLRQDERRSSDHSFHRKYSPTSRRRYKYRPFSTLLCRFSCSWMREKIPAKNMTKATAKTRVNCGLKQICVYSVYCIMEPFVSVFLLNSLLLSVSWLSISVSWIPMSHIISLALHTNKQLGFILRSSKIVHRSCEKLSQCNTKTLARTSHNVLCTRKIYARFEKVVRWIATVYACVSQTWDCCLTCLK